jgi:hypothetical protein
MAVARRSTEGLGLLWALLLTTGCSSREMVLGGDPLALAVAGEGGTAPTANGGTGGGSGSGGVPGGGTSGIIIPSGGSAGTGAAGAANDPYPPVIYDNGQGYRASCPDFGDVWGFTCWHFENGMPSTCGLDGTPSCNACSCAVPCGPRDECPNGRGGELAICVESPTTVKSCFIDCDEQNCPVGMTCSDYPGTQAHVCIWEESNAASGVPTK